MTGRSAVMVGRDGELARLLDAVDLAGRGTAQIAVVAGEAGIGKTRLVRELVERVPPDVVVAFGHAVPLTGGPLPYGVASDLLRSLVREVQAKAVQDALGPRAEVLAPLVPRLGHGTEATLDRPAVYAATQDLLAELAADQPLLLVVEDLHWTDEASLDLLMFWARTLVRGRLLIVVTRRDQGVDEAVLTRLGELRRLPNTTALDLVPLPSEGIEAQVRSLDESADAELVAEIQRLSDGNPLFVEELVAGGTGGPSASLTLDLAGRLGGVSPETSAVVQLAAVESRPFDAEMLATVAERPGTDVALALDEASSHGLVRRDAGRQWGFHHELLRQAVLASGSTTSREAAHRRWATVLSGDGAGVDDLISAADHWEAVGDLEETFRLRLRAARAIRDHLGPAAAGDEWRRVLRLLQAHPGLGSEEVHEQAIIESGAADLVWAREMQVVEAEERTARSPGPVRQAWTVLVRFCASRSIEDVSGPDLSAADLERMREMLVAEPARPAVLRVMGLVVRAANIIGAESLRNGSIELYDRMTAEAPPELAGHRVAVMEWRLLVLWERDWRNIQRFQEIVDEALAYDDVLGPYDRAQVRVRLADLYAVRGDFPRALTVVNEVVRILHGPEAGGFIWSYAQTVRMGVQIFLGQWDDLMSSAERLYADRDHLESHNMAVTYAAVIHAWRGDVEAALEARSLLMPVVLSGHDATTGYETRHCSTLTEAFARGRSDPDRARACLLPWLEDPDLENHAMGGHFALLAAQLATRGSPAGEYAARVAAAAEQIYGDAAPDLASRRHVAAFLAQATGADTVDEWAAVVAAWEELSATSYAVDARLQLAHALVRDGQRDLAAQELAPALTVAEQLGATPLADDIRGLAARARLRLPGFEPAERTSTRGLTGRELEVLELLVQGMTNDQIGSTLFMSPRTASVHVSRILAKLGAANRTEVAAIAHRSGLVG